MATQAAFNPNTGSPLYVGQTTTKDGITYTGTTSNSSTTNQFNTQTGQPNSNYIAPTPTPTSSPTPTPTYDPSWSISGWQTDGNGNWSQQPVLTINGRMYRFNTPQEYINAINNAGIKSGNISQMISEFQGVTPEWNTVSTKTPTPTPTTAPNYTGLSWTPAEIKRIQGIVGTTQDGIMGINTGNAVKAWQSAHGVAPDGVWGPTTEAAYTKISNPSSPTPTVKPANDPSNQYNTSTGQLNTNWTGYSAYIQQQPITTPTPTPTTAKPSGLQTITGTLNFGSQGDQVKALQTYLAGMGYKNTDGTPLKVDGIYGANTRTAVSQFQAQNGLTADGVFGPLTKTKATTIASTGIAATNPNSPVTTPTPDGTTTPDGVTTYNTGNPALDSTLQAMEELIRTQQDKGLAINPDLVFDQVTLDKFLETAKKQIHPFYAQQIDQVKQEVLRNVPQVLQEYENKIADTTQNFQDTLGTSRENAAGTGTTFSGARIKGELGMQSAQDRSLSGLSTAYGNKLYDYGTTAEKALGSSNVDFTIPSLSTYSTSLSGSGNINRTGTTSPYAINPNSYRVGTLTQEEQAAIEARNQALKKTAGEAITAGRSYNDLFA